MVALQSWFKEHWIKTVTKEDFIAWGKVNQKQYTEEELAWIYDSHVAPLINADETICETELAMGHPELPLPDPDGVYIDTELE